MIETDRIYLMDCMEGMKQIADGSVDAIIADRACGSCLTAGVIVLF